ncbi:DUF4276 family protein [Nocardia shimofusensis]|uniref:DUF4276 family protein n=1 Tax=Nocardia shimofusensis TaxID=228596 RepID=UPI000A0311E2|nr:DUF4276 family protein [Nocardia shimofusensis]
MKIAILTEGKGEFKTLPNLYPQIKSRLPKKTQVMKPMMVHAAPDGPVGQLVTACRTPLKLAIAEKADKAILLIDREQQAERPGEIAAEIQAALRKVTDLQVDVAIKDRMFENWLISDLNALRAQPARFTVTPALVNKVEPNKADSVNALELLKKTVAPGRDYDKIIDGERISTRAQVELMAKHSRSFRHFLHLLGYEAYREQCLRPC